MAAHRRISTSYRLPLLLILVLAGAACSTGGGTQPEEPLEAEVQQVPAPAGEMFDLPAMPPLGGSAVILAEDDYKIGPADELEIEIFQVDELSGTEKVNSRGYIKMPLIGAVKVAGLSREQAEDLIAELFAVNYLQDPQVNIDISDYASQQVTLLGAVEKPGIYPLKGHTTLMQALAMAEGTERLADKNHIVVFRTDPEGRVVGYVVNLDEIIAGVKKDPEVIGNDKIVVPESGSKSFIKGITDTLRGFIGFRPY